MPVRTCPNCGKEFKQKIHYDKHIDPNRRFPCLASKFDIAPKCTEITPENTEFAPKKLTCLHCHESFSRSSSLKRHQEGRCKKMSAAQIGGNKDIKSLVKIIEDQNKIIGEQAKKMEELEKKIDEKNVGDTINNNNSGTVNNGTINNNIIVVAYGDEKNRLDTKIICDAILAGDDCIPKYIELLHFNPNNPENHNIYKPKMSEPYVNVRTHDNTWELHNEKNIYGGMVTNVAKVVQKEMKTNDDVKKEMNKYTAKTLMGVCDRHLGDVRGIPNSDSEDELERNELYKKTKAMETRKEVEGKLSLLLYNKRDIPKNTMRKEKEEKKKQEIVTLRNKRIILKAKKTV